MKPINFKTILTKIGAWTVAFATVDTKKIFEAKGHIRVKGTIDGKPFSGVSLMPVKNGNHLLAVNTALRKAINKEAGEEVTIVLERDNDELEIPAELTEALEASEEAKKLFYSFSYSHKKLHVQYITEAKQKVTRENRAVKIIMKLELIYKIKNHQ